MSIIEERKLRLEESSHEIGFAPKPSAVNGLQAKLHELKKKNAISRQEIAIAEREQADYKAKIGEAKETILSLSRLRERDDKLLRQEEKSIATAQCSHIMNGSLVSELIEERLQINKDWILESKQYFDEETDLYKRSSHLSNEVKTWPNINSIQSLFEIYQELIKRKEASQERDENYIKQNTSNLCEQKKYLEKLKERLTEQRMNNQKTKFKLESFIGRVTGGYKFHLRREHKGENAMQAADAIVNRLKSKLGRVNAADHSPASRPSDLNDMPNKKRVLHFDFRKSK